MNQRELKQSIEEDPNLTDSEKARKLNTLCAPYIKMSDAELLQLVRDFTICRYGGQSPGKKVYVSYAFNSSQTAGRGRKCRRFFSEEEKFML